MNGIWNKEKEKEKEEPEGAEIAGEWCL